MQHAMHAAGAQGNRYVAGSRRAPGYRRSWRHALRAAGVVLGLWGLGCHPGTAIPAPVAAPPALPALPGVGGACFADTSEPALAWRALRMFHDLAHAQERRVRLAQVESARTHASALPADSVRVRFIESLRTREDASPVHGHKELRLRTDADGVLQVERETTLGTAPGLFTEPAPRNPFTIDASQLGAPVRAELRVIRDSHAEASRPSTLLLTLVGVRGDSHTLQLETDAGGCRFDAKGVGIACFEAGAFVDFTLRRDGDLLHVSTKLGDESEPDTGPRLPYAEIRLPSAQPLSVLELQGEAGAGAAADRCITRHVETRTL